MKFLLDLPFVMSLASWIWGEDPSDDVYPELCIESLPFMTSGCLSRLLIKGLGIGIILGACLNKIPIMLNILNSKSTAGMSRGAVYGEVITVANGTLYGYLEKFPITAYGENVALLLQSIVIALLVWQFSVPPVGLQERSIAVTAFAMYVGGITMILPSDLHYLLMASIWPVMLYSRGSQILETQRVKHTGANSVVTTSMNLVGSLIRILTTIKEVGYDFAVLTGFCIAVLLNGAMLVQYFVYRSNTEQFYKDLAKKKT